MDIKEIWIWSIKEIGDRQQVNMRWTGDGQEMDRIGQEVDSKWTGGR